MAINYPADRETKFKSGNGHFYTKQLFHELFITIDITQRTTTPLFTLHEPKHGLICFRHEYVSDGDPTGYKTAMRLLDGNFRHWQALLKCTWFTEAKKEWDAELDAKLKSEGLSAIRMVASSEDKNALVAAKYLANKDYKEKVPSTTRGRPSKEEIAGEVKRNAQEEAEIANDAVRLKLVKN